MGEGGSGGEGEVVIGGGVEGERREWDRGREGEEIAMMTQIFFYGTLILNRVDKKFSMQQLTLKEWRT